MSRDKPSRHRPCQVCRHPDRLRIELLRLTGVSLDRLAARFKVHRDAINRHMVHLDQADRVALIADLPMKRILFCPNQSDACLDPKQMTRKAA